MEANQTISNAAYWTGGRVFGGKLVVPLLVAKISLAAIWFFGFVAGILVVNFSSTAGATLAFLRRLGLAKIGSTIHPYSAQAEAIRKLGDQFNKTRLTAQSKSILSLLFRMHVGS